MDAVAVRRVPDALDIAPEALTSAVAAVLIEALNAELAARYPEPGATHFRLDSDEVAPGTGIFLVARWFGRPVGCGALRCLREAALMPELGPRVGELKRMYVAPELRGHGIGRALLVRLEAEARALSVSLGLCSRRGPDRRRRSPSTATRDSPRSRHTANMRRRPQRASAWQRRCKHRYVAETPNSTHQADCLAAASN
jgi:GNAT superfamily N-acetyltransferase